MQKPKEPLLAVLLSVIFPGLGHLYAGRRKRGVYILILNVMLIVAFMSFGLHPTLKTERWHLFTIPLIIAAGLWFVIDSYLCARKFNSTNHLERKISFRKRTFLIAGILCLSTFFNINELSRLYIVQAFNIPAGSMNPTLLENDRVLVNKIIYRNSEPERGDIVVFKNPSDPKRVFMMRIVGLPNEKLAIRDGRIFINGGKLNNAGFISGNHYYNKGSYGLEKDELRIPADSYFILGDNSQTSNDSRFLGFVPRKNILGKAFRIYFPLERSGPIK